MNQTIYVKEIPKSCKDCPCCSCDTKKEFITNSTSMYCNLLKQGFYWKDYRLKLKDCPLKSLHEHNKELVEKVLESIKKHIEKYTAVVIEENNFDTITGHGLDFVLKLTQKEFEDGKK